MRSSTSGAIAGSGLGVTVATPTISHAAGTGFTITNFDSSVVYTLSAGSRSSGNITLGMSTPATLYAKSAKGVTATATVTLERRTITYTSPVFHQTGNYYTYNGPCNVGSTCYGTCGSGTNNCGVTPGYITYDGEDSPPSGFTKLNGEWVKIA